MFYLLTVPRGWQCEGLDEIEYLGVGHSLARGQGYAVNGEPHTLYPPAYPVVVAALMKVWPGNWRALYAANAMIGLAGVIYLASWLRRVGGRAGAWAGWLSIASYYAWSFSTRFLLADQLLLFACAVVLVEWDRLLRVASRSAWSVGWVVAGTLLAVMAKAGAYALLGALAVSAAVAFARGRKIWVAGLVAVLLGGAFTLGWEVRARNVNPSAKESYGRWVMKWLGLSKETSGVIAQNAGEGVEGPTTFAQRAGILGIRAGTYLLSLTRPPANATPVALFAALCLVVGMFREIRERPDSAWPWFAAFSFGLFALTSWVSSYHRYLYSLTPLLFHFALRGAAALRRTPHSWLLLIPFALWTAVASFARGLAPESALGMERWYAMAAGLALVLGAVAAPLVSTRFRSDRAMERMLAVGVIVLALHNVGLAAQRFRLTLGNAMPRERNLAGALAAADWVRAHTPSDARIASSFPRITGFLCDRDVANLERADYALLFGPLRGVPAFDSGVEAALALHVEASGSSPVFASDAAAVYKVGP